LGIVITVMNMKGGVGKTTVATHFAGIAARVSLGAVKPQRVLAIDYDPQFNMSQALLTSAEYFRLEQKRRTTLAILADDGSEIDPFQLNVAGNHNPPLPSKISVNIFKNQFNNGILDLVPSTLDLMYVALGRANNNIAKMEERFAKFIKLARDDYDLIVIDCHPAGSVFTDTSLKNSDHVLIPVAPQRYAVRGIGLMMEFIEAKRVGSHRAKPHILFNHVPRSGTSQLEIDVRANRKFAPHCLTNSLKKYSAFSDPSEGTGFVWSSSKPYSDEAYLNLVRVATELMNRINAEE
jgi:chromosome partitioning protein